MSSEKVRPRIGESQSQKRNKPIVSVYIVNFNYGQYLVKAIESVLNQTFSGYELLIIDNGSTDSSKEILKEYVENQKIRILCLEKTSIGQVCNLALDQTSGKYIVRLDADDYLHTNALEIMTRDLERKPESALIFPDYYIVDDEENIVELVRRNDSQDAQVLDRPANGAGMIIRREHLEAVGGYDNDIDCQDGWDIWCKFRGRYNISHIDLPLFYYRKHSNNLTRDEHRLLNARSKILQRASSVGQNAPSCLAVIPVRGPTLEPHSKCLAQLGDKKLIDWTILAALSARRVSEVIIVSPDPDVEGHIESQYGKQLVLNKRVRFIRRSWSKSLIGQTIDLALTEVFDVLSTENINYDRLVLLFVNSPFRTSRDIDAACDAMDVFQCDRVVGIRRAESNVYLHNREGVRDIRMSNSVRDEACEPFVESGEVCVIRRFSMWKDMPKDEHIGFIEVDEIAGLRIYSEDSWNIANYLANQMC